MRSKSKVRVTTNLTAEEIEAARTPRGGWTKKQLAQWGVKWPPPRGWKRQLLGNVKVETNAKTQVELPRVKSEYEAWFDGACWPNPNGHAACGALVKRNGETIWTFCDYLGNEGTSNNVAEYAGLAAVLSYLHQNSVESCVIYGDSNLVIKQMNREWNVGTLNRKERNGKSPIRPRYYLKWYEMATEIRSKMTTILTFQWTPREKNTEADELSSRPLRERGIRNIYHYERPETDLEYVDRLFEQVVASAPTGDPNCPF